MNRLTYRNNWKYQSNGSIHTLDICSLEVPSVCFKYSTTPTGHIEYCTLFYSKTPEENISDSGCFRDKRRRDQLAFVFCTQTEADLERKHETLQFDL